MHSLCCLLFFSSRRRQTRCALGTGVQTCALPIWPGNWSRRIAAPSATPCRGASTADDSSDRTWSRTGTVIADQLTARLTEALWASKRLVWAIFSRRSGCLPKPPVEIGRAHVRTPATNSYLLGRHLLGSQELSLQASASHSE